MKTTTAPGMAACSWILGVLCIGLPACAGVSTVAAVDGLEIAYADRAADQARQQEPTLVLVHGWACDREFWGELPERLGSDHRVVSMDLPGHGQSGRERATWDVVALGSDVVTVCDQLELNDVVLIGHSMGATVALSAAAEMQGRVRAVIALDSLHEIEGPIPVEMVETLAAAFKANWREAMYGAVSSMVPAGPNSKLTHWIVARAVRTDQRAALALMRSSGGLDLVALAQAAAVPVRVVNAAPYPRGAETLLEINRSLIDYDALLIDDVGHYLQLERPDAVEEAIRKFLNEFDTQP